MAAYGVCPAALVLEKRALPLARPAAVIHRALPRSHCRRAAVRGVALATLVVLPLWVYPTIRVGQHMRELMPSRNVPRGQGPVAVLTKGMPSWGKQLSPIEVRPVNTRTSVTGTKQCCR